MALNLGSASADLTLNIDGFMRNAQQAEQAMDRLGSSGGGMFGKAEKSVESFGHKVERLGPQIQTVGVALVGLGVGITAAFGGAIKSSIDFNSAMANVNSIAQLTTAEMAALSDEVLSLSTATGQGPQVLAEGLYDIYSSGFAGAEGLQVLEAAANAANAGLTTTATSAKAITAVLNAYGLDATDATHISDVLFQTVNDGVLSFEQLATNMGNTLPLGNALGVSFEELAAAYAQMTLNGISATQAETQISALLRAAINPTEALTEAVNAYGYETASALIEAEGMPGFLNLLTETAGGSSEVLFDLLGTSEAVNAALVLGKNDVADYTAELERMTGSSEGVGATQEALAKQMESTGFQLQRLKANFQVLLITIGTFFEPAIRAVANGMEKLIQIFLAVPEGVQKAIAIITAVIGSLALLGGTFLLVLPQILQFRNAMAAIGGMKGVVSLISGGLGFGSFIPLVLAATAAIGGLTLAYGTNFLGFRDLVDNVIDKVQEFFGLIGIGSSKFEFDLGLDFGIPDITKKIDDAIKSSPLGSFTKGLGAFGDTMDGVGASGEAMANFMRSGGDAIEEFAGDFVSATSSINPATKILYGIGYALEAVGAQSLGKGIQRTAVAIEQLGDFTSDLWRGGPRAAIRAYERLPKSLRPVAKVIGGIVQGVRDLGTAWMQGGFRAFAIQLPQSIAAIGTGVDEAFQELTGRGITDWTLNVAAPTLGGWIVDAAVGTFDALIDLAGWAGGKILDLVDWSLDVAAPTLIGWVSSVGSDVWSFIRGAAGWVGGIVGSIGAWTLEVGVPTVWGWITNVASNVWAWLKVAAGWTGNVIGNIGAWTLEVGAPTVFGWITNVAGNVWSYLKIAGGWVGNVAGDIGAWTLEVGAPTVFGWIKNVASNVWAWLQIAAGWAGRLIGDISDWTLNVAAPSVVDFVGDIGTIVDQEVQSAYADYVAGGGYTSLPSAEAKIETITVDASGAEIVEKEGTGDSWYEKGYKYGITAMGKVIEGLNAGADFFTGSNGGAGGGAGGGVTIWEIFDNFASTVSGAFTASMDLIVNELSNPGSFTQLIGDILYAMFIQPFVDIGKDLAELGSTMAEGAMNLIQPILDIPDQLSGLGETIGGALDAIASPFESAWDGAIAAYRYFRKVVFGDQYSNTDEGSYANAGGTNDGSPGLGSGAGGSMTDSEGNQTPVSFLPKTGAGPQGTKVPPLDTSAFDASATAFTAKLQGILTAVNAVFVTALPANITAGMTASTTSITTGTTLWATTTATQSQSILTLVNAVFAVGIPANITAGMTSSTATITSQEAVWTATTAAQSQAILSVVNAVFVGAIPANVNSGMSAASNSIRSAASSWPGIINGIAGAMGSAGYNAGAAAGFGVANGMASALGSIQSRASQIASIVSNTIALQLQIASPSKVTTRLGEYTGEGFALGIESQESRVRSASERLSDVAAQAMGHGSRVQVPGGGAAPGDQGGGTGGGGTTPSTSPQEIKWSDEVAKGLVENLTDSIKNSGLEFDKTLGSLFNEEDWLARVKALSEKGARNINDLFIGRTRLNDTDFSLMDGKYLEHYGGGVIPDQTIAPYPPNIPDPTKPPKDDVIVKPGKPGYGYVSPKGQFPNRPNNGSSKGSTGTVINIHQEDQRTQVSQQLESERFSQILRDGEKGRTAYGTLANGSTRRTMTSGPSKRVQK